MWCIVSATGSMANTILNFVFMLFYSVSINSPRTVTQKKRSSPTLIVILSLVYSLIYIIGETTIYFLTRYNVITLAENDIFNYFDISTYQKDVMMPSVFIPMCVLAFGNLIFLILFQIVSIKWFSSSKSSGLMAVNRITGIIFMVAFAFTISICQHKYLVFMNVVFGINCLFVGLKSTPMPQMFVAYYWKFFIGLMFLYLVVISSDDLLIEISMDKIPRWARIVSIFITSYFASIFCASNRINIISPMRLIGYHKIPFIIRACAPYVVIAMAYYYCMSEVSWLSFVAFLISTISALLGAQSLANLAPYVFVANITLMVVQFVIAPFVPLFKLENEYADIGVFILAALSALIMSNSQKTYFTAEISKHKNWITIAQGLISVIELLLVYILFALFAGLNSSAIVSCILALVIFIAISGFYRPLAWLVVLVILGSAAASNIVLILLVRHNGIKLPEVVFKTVFIDVDPYGDVYKGVWPLLLMFVLVLILKSVFIPPHHLFMSFIKYLIIPVSIIGLIIGLPNSAFKLFYIIVAHLFIISVATNKQQIISFVFVIVAIVSTLHLVCIQLYNFEIMRNSVLIPRLRVILGFPKDGDIYDPTFGTVLLTVLILSISIVFKFTTERTFHLPLKNRPKMKQFLKIVKSSAFVFSFYLFLIAVFLANYEEGDPSAIEIVMLVVSCFHRFFAKRGGWFAILMYLIYSCGYLIQIVVSLIDIPDNLQKIFDIVGPSSVTAESNAINMAVVLTSFLFAVSDPKGHEFPKLLLDIISYVKKNLIVILQMILSISAVNSSHILAPFAAILMCIIISKVKIGRVFAHVYSFIMMLLMAYLLVFSLYKIDHEHSDEYSDYFLLSNITHSDLAHAFSQLFVSLLFLEFGIGETPGFGNTIFTAYGFPIFSSIIAVLTLCIHNYSALIHTIIWMFIIFVTLSRWEPFMKGIYACVLYTVLVVVAKSLRPAPFFSHGESPVDKIFGLDKSDDGMWVAILSCEYLLYTFLNSDEYKEVQQRQNARRLNRAKRQEIFSRIHDKDELFVNRYFEDQLGKLQADFETLTEVSDYVPTALSHEQTKEILNMNEDKSDDPSTPKVKLTFPQKVIQAVKSLAKSIFEFVVDYLSKKVLHNFVDINLEPNISIPGVEKFEKFFDAVLDVYDETKKVVIPEEWAVFASTIPPSFASRFRLVSRLKIPAHYDTMNRLAQLRRNFSIFLHQAPEVVLMILIFFYPMKQLSVFTLVFFIIASTTIMFKIHTYKHIFTYQAIVMSIRYIITLPGIAMLVNKAKDSLEERGRALPLFIIFGLDNLEKTYLYDAFILSLAICATINLRNHPQMHNKSIGDTKIKRLFSRFSKHSSTKIHFTSTIITLELINFLILLFSYGGWIQAGSNFMKMVSGSNFVSPFYVFCLILHFSFIFMIAMASISKSAIPYFIVSNLFALSTFSVIFFAIPYYSFMQCLESLSFKVYLFFRLTCQILMSLQLYFGFNHDPPHDSHKKPLIVVATELIIRNVPFLFEITVVVKWIAIKTSISLFNTLILQQLKSKLKQRSSMNMMFAQNVPQEGRIEGYAFLIAMILLLFVPLMLLSGSDRVTVLNPANIVNVHYGVAGLPNLFEYQMTIENRKLTINEQAKINELGDATLSTFYSMPREQIQVIELPLGSMTNWYVSSDAKDQAIKELDDNRTVSPYGTLSFVFKLMTTKNKVDEVMINTFGQDLNSVQRKDLMNALKTQADGSTIEIPGMIPMFIEIPYDDTAIILSKYYYNIKFELKNNNGTIFWRLRSLTPDSLRIPSFMENRDTTTICVWSQTVPDQIIGTILTSTGGIMGLYAFIIITIGQFISMWISSLFTDLWLTRMHNPRKLLNILLAIEAYQLSGKLDEEFRLSEILLENLRSTMRIIKITDVHQSDKKENNENDDITDPGPIVPAQAP